MTQEPLFPKIPLNPYGDMYCLLVLLDSHNDTFLGAKFRQHKLKPSTAAPLSPYKAEAAETPVKGGVKIYPCTSVLVHNHGCTN